MTWGKGLPSPRFYIHEGCCLNITFQHIHKRFGKVHANNDINLTLPSGTIQGVLGENGAGKSTILSLIQRHFDITQGDVRFHDIPLTLLQLDSWRSRLAPTAYIWTAAR